MHCLSMSYKTTPLQIRQQLSFTLDEKLQFENQVHEKAAKGCIIISTCNRTEIYFSGDQYSIYKVEDMIVKEKKIAYNDLKKYIHVYSNEGAIRHLCHLICGMDSMVIGEDEILRQVKEAYISSLMNKTTNDELNIIFQKAFNLAKTVKTDTKISTTPISMGTLSVNEIIKFIKKKEVANVLMVGATGKMGSIIVKNLFSKKGIKIVGTRRSHRGDLFNGDKPIRWIPYEERYQFILWADVIISATTSPHYTFTSEEVKEALGDDDSNRLFIDLAVPCDIDKAIGRLGNISMVDIDDFEYLAKENNQIKLKEMEKAKGFIEEKVEGIWEIICRRKLFQGLTIGIKEGI